MPSPPRLSASYSTISADDLLKQVVGDYEIDSPRECVFWERGSNDTYEVRCSDARYSLRVYRCDAFPREAIEFEAEVLGYLNEQKFPVAYPIARKDGNYLTEIAAPEGLRFVLLTNFADGATPNYQLPENCRLVGASVAQMHLALRGFETTRVRTRLDLKGLLDDSLTTIRPHLIHRSEDWRFLEETAEAARAAVHAVSEESLDMGICHGDLHGYNLHLHEGKLTHFDFEECAFGYRIYDLATFKWGCCRGEHRAKRWPVFLEGYQSVRSLSASELSLIDTFVVIRDISNVAFGMRNLTDFGHELASNSELDDILQQLKEFAENAR